MIDNLTPRTIKHRKSDDLRDYGPFYYVAGTNGTDLIVNYCEKRGWKRIFDNNRGDYVFKWSEFKMISNYQNFRPGRQILNQIPNTRILTTKAGLCSSLKEYERIAIKYSKDVYSQYIVRPLLLEGRKFDVRSYFLVACTAPFMAFFHHGYARSTCNTYDPFSDDLTSHLTNQFIQRKNPLYNGMKEETIWSMERLNKYINEKYMKEKHLPKDWVFTVFAKRMQEIMTICFNTARSKLDPKLGCFDLMGCDFIIDQNFKVWLLEMNANPSLHRHCSVLKTLIPQLVYEALDVVLEIFKKCSKGAYILPLQSQKEFVLIYNNCHLSQIPRPLRVGGTSPTISKQPSPLCPRSLKRPVRKSLRKPSAITSLSDHTGVEMKPLQKAVSMLSHGQLPVIAQIQSLYCAESKAKTNHFLRSQAASLEGWSQLQTSVSKPMMMTAPFMSGLNKRFAAIPKQSKSLESSLLFK
ncbi:hypothetical protein chiPu_0001914 [Chiloscyllium punctatum]|uniref:Uncharacterized protein n=1 Tax=Chiloscyllium punctatum TaxID=137246 RepID=A0A401RZJ1_CHIPU|nr:hypothetical protein [Chiloscyllium punctatum]